MSKDIQRSALMRCAAARHRMTNKFLHCEEQAGVFAPVGIDRVPPSAITS